MGPLVGGPCPTLCSRLSKNLRLILVVVVKQHIVMDIVGAIGDDKSGEQASLFVITILRVDLEGFNSFVYCFHVVRDTSKDAFDYSFNIL